jgi:hypothetical protein
VALGGEEVQEGGADLGGFHGSGLVVRVERKGCGIGQAQAWPACR